MSVTPTQKKAIDQILAVFETGRLPSPTSYSTVAVLTDGAGISYGKHQSTDRSGSLDAIVLRYIDLAGTTPNAQKLFAYLDELERNDTAKVNPKALPQWVKDLKTVLAEAGKEPLMQQAQDEIFDENYWNPAVTQAKAIGLKYALSYAVIYDTCIHSGPGGVNKIRKNFPEKSPANGGDEKAWVQAYVKARRVWLASSSNDLVKKTVYRMDAFQKLIDAGNWDLVTPFKIRTITIP